MLGDHGKVRQPVLLAMKGGGQEGGAGLGMCIYRRWGLTAEHLARLEPSALASAHTSSSHTVLPWPRPLSFALTGPK